MSKVPPEEAAVSYNPEDGTEVDIDPRVAQVKQRHEVRLMAIEGVEGVGIGTGELGDDVIVVYVRDKGYGDEVPKEIEGVRVRAEVTGVIDAR